MSRTGHLAMSGDKQREGILLASSGWRPRILLNIFQCVGQPDNKEFSWVHSLSRVQLFATPQTAARQASPSVTNSRSLLKLMSIELVMPSNHLILQLIVNAMRAGISVLFTAVSPARRIVTALSRISVMIRWIHEWMNEQESMTSRAQSIGIFPQSHPASLPATSWCETTF